MPGPTYRGQPRCADRPPRPIAIVVDEGVAVLAEWQGDNPEDLELQAQTELWALYTTIWIDEEYFSGIDVTSAGYWAADYCIGWFATKAEAEAKLAELEEFKLAELERGAA